MKRFLVACAMALLLPLPALATVSVVGTGKGGGGSAASFSIIANQTPTASDVLEIGIFLSSNGTVTPPSNWVSDAQPSTNHSMFLGHCVVTSSNCNSSSIGSFSFSSGAYCYALEEFSGVSSSPFELASTIQSFSSTNNNPSYSVTPAAYNAGIFAVFGGFDNRSGFTAGSGYTHGVNGTDGSHAWCYDEWTNADVTSGPSTVAGTLGATGSHSLYSGAIVMQSGSSAPPPRSNRMMMGCCKK